MNLLSLPGLYVLILLISLVFTVFGPALSSSVPLIVPRSQLTAANALIQSTATIGMLLGPVISGPGIAWIGAEHMLYVGAPAFVVAALVLFPVRLEESRRRAHPANPSFVHDLMLGLRYAWMKHGAVRAILTATALHSMVASAFVFLLPVYADRALQAGPMELGWLWSLYGGGMFLAAGWLTIARHEQAHDRVWTVCVALAGGALAAGLLAVVLPFPLLLVLNAVIGFSLGMFTPVAWGLLQEWVPAGLRGRVFAMASTAAMSASLIGMLLFGWLADTWGPKAGLIVMAVMLSATSLLVLRIKEISAGQEVGEEGVEPLRSQI
jgi:MFS family permease